MEATTAHAEQYLVVEEIPKEGKGCHSKGRRNAEQMTEMGP